jgi:uncharacterized membrane-anchored protein YhcB (DUF1043 family)
MISYELTALYAVVAFMAGIIAGALLIAFTRGKARAPYEEQHEHIKSLREYGL